MWRSPLASLWLRSGSRCQCYDLRSERGGSKHNGPINMLSRRRAPETSDIYNFQQQHIHLYSPISTTQRQLHQLLYIMYQNRLVNDSQPKPFAGTESFEVIRNSGSNLTESFETIKSYGNNTLLKEVDEELKRLRNQYDNIAGSSIGNTNIIPASSAGFSASSTYYSSPQGSKIETTSRPAYITESHQQSSFDSGRDISQRDFGRYRGVEVAGGVPQNASSYGYQTGSLATSNISGSPVVSSGNKNSNTSSPSSLGQREIIVKKIGSSNTSFQSSPPVNVTNGNRCIEPTQQIQSQPTQQYYQPNQSSPPLPSVSIVEVSTNEPLRIPVAQPEVVRISSPQSQTIRINSPPKIRSGPSPAQIARAQEEAKRLAEMQIIERQRELARQHQQQAARLRQQSQRAASQRRQREEREAMISRTQLENYVNNINDKNRKISELESKITQMGYQTSNAQTEANRYKAEVQALKNSHRVQLENVNSTVANLRREIDLLNREKEKGNVELENKINRMNFAYEEVNALNNRLNRDLQNLKREFEKKHTNTEVNQSLFEDFKQKINEKTLRISQLQKQLYETGEKRNQLQKRVDDLLLQGYEPKKQINLEKLDKQPSAFNQILKLNLEENQTYKANLAVKDEEIFRLEEMNRALRGENERIKNELEIERLKRMTELKNTQTTMEIQLQVKQNEINNLNNVIVAFEQKLKFIVQEDRKKDQFMVTYLKGRAQSVEEKQSIEDFFKKFELLSVNTNIAESLKREQIQIQRLKDEVERLHRERR